jgi:hypothetical protein
VFPQFVDGKDSPSNLVLVNPSAARTATGTAQLFDSSGQPLSVGINGSMQEGSFPFSVPPLGIGVYTTGGTGNTTVGSARVSSDDPVGGTILFSGSMGVAGVGAANMAAHLVVPIESDVSRGIYTGVALANPYYTELRLTLDLLDLHGDPIESARAAVSLPANGQIARFPEELFSGSAVDFSRFRGTLRVQSPLSMSAMAIRLKPGQYATLPVTPVGAGSQKLRFAHTANGQGMASTVMLINPSAIDTARGVVRFTANDGSPLPLSVEGNPQSETIDFTIPPLAAAFFSTDGSGALTTGWAEVIADTPVGGTILFSGPDGMAGVAATEPAADFLVPVESNAAANVFTGVALSNPSDSAVDVTLLLRDSMGTQLPDGVVQMTLSPRAHAARFVEELFRDRAIDLSAFRGTLEARAALPIGGMALRASPAEYSTLPVIPVAVGPR